MPSRLRNTRDALDDLENRKEGILVQDGDPYSFAGAIIELYNDIDLSNRIGNCAREKALIRHNAKDISVSILNTYNTIIEL